MNIQKCFLNFYICIYKKEITDISVGWNCSFIYKIFSAISSETLPQCLTDLNNLRLKCKSYFFIVHHHHHLYHSRHFHSSRLVWRCVGEWDSWLKDVASSGAQPAPCGTREQRTCRDNVVRGQWSCWSVRSMLRATQHSRQVPFPTGVSPSDGEEDH